MDDSTNTRATHRRDVLVATSVLAYAATVLTVDTLAAQRVTLGIDWDLFDWQGASGFDAFKFIAWFVVPFVLLWATGRLDRGYFGVRRWKRVDWVLLLAVVAVGMAAVLSIRVFPSLQAWYHGMGSAPAAVRWRFAGTQLTWTLSWIVGWEFLHRYALLSQLERAWPRYGWLAVPVFEGAYHLQKAPLEMAGMVVFSVLLTAWARRRCNALLPFLAHLAIELELLAFLLLTP